MKPKTFRVRASKGGVILTEPKGLTNAQKYANAVESLASKKKRLEEFKNPDCKTAVELRNNGIPAAKKLVEELYKVKDEVQLSKTCIDYLKEWIIEQKYGRKKEFSSRPTDKGDRTEQDGLQLIQDLLYPGVFIPKSKTFYEDQYKTGNLDALVVDTIIDNKSSYTVFSFPFDEEEATDFDHICQMQTYIDIVPGATKARLCYTLNDTPFDIIDSELRSYAYRNNIPFDEFPEDKAYEIIKNHIYTREGLEQFKFVLGTHDTSDFIEIPKEKRLKYFDIERDDELIERINKRSQECDDWVQANWDKF